MTRAQAAEKVAEALRVALFRDGGCCSECGRYEHDDRGPHYPTCAAGAALAAYEASAGQGTASLPYPKAGRPVVTERTAA